MIIQTEIRDPGGQIMIEFVSDKQMLLQCGDQYYEVVRDAKGYEREYIETDIPWGSDIPKYDDETEEYAKAGKILMGVE